MLLTLFRMGDQKAPSPLCKIFRTYPADSTVVLDTDVPYLKKI